ncbi:recombinase family protein [Mesorhizobium sp. SARCC-RB16n]|uniref:recombinase family protein n=1 Tax=Mesorhizobium sp. SARCC-RB16n TaxID=2116687 RepID=UPI0027BAAA2A|nr:recombinase family protein [Mesorhizobium sp. SARCC-RB16n]
MRSPPAARPAREDDTVVAWKLDRLSRSLKDVLHIMERIETAGVGFRSLTEAIDTTTPAGRMIMQMVDGWLIAHSPNSSAP